MEADGRQKDRLAGIELSEGQIELIPLFFIGLKVRRRNEN